MTTPRTLRVAITLSIATTGGALYYYLSDGGNPRKFDELMSSARDEVTDSYYTFRKKAEHLLSSQKQTAQSSTEHQTVEDASPGLNTTDKPKESNTEHAEIPSRSSSPFCHTCSGARIWVFAERLRITHLLNKYADTSTESRD
ncbi:hypothetical protein FGB62_7g455 [Gracilaria domingensis]|nr:hypothetical protein FGB62_7g455 [Gracilaria domingensis]